MVSYVYAAIFPLHIFIFGNHSLLFLSFNSSPLLKKFIDFLILQIDHDLACPSVPFQFHFWKGIFQHKKLWKCAKLITCLTYLKYSSYFLLQFVTKIR